MAQQSDVEARIQQGAGSPASRQVSWYETFSYASRFAAQHGVGLDHLPIAGTPQWCGMADDDARKLLSLVLGGVREALNHDVAQEHRAEASREVSTSADWSAISRRIRCRNEVYIPREVA